MTPDRCHVASSNRSQLQAQPNSVKPRWKITGNKFAIGQYGSPWELATGMNWFPTKGCMFKGNGELLDLDGSPAGYASVPIAVGGTGLVFNANVELTF